MSEEFKIKDGVLEKYTGKDREVVIPEGVTEIGVFAFDSCESLKEITYRDEKPQHGRLH